MPIEERLLARLPEPVTPSNLGDRVFRAIVRAKMRRIRHRFILVLMGLLACFAYAAANLSALWAELQASSFVSMLRLSLSDSDVLFRHSRDLLFALLDSFPLVSALLVLLCAFFLIGTAMFGNALRYTRRDLLTPSTP